MSELTENEMKLLRAILTNEAHDTPLGEERIGSSVWCESINEAKEPTGIKDGKSSPPSSRCSARRSSSSRTARRSNSQRQAMTPP